MLLPFLIELFLNGTVLQSNQLAASRPEIEERYRALFEEFRENQAGFPLQLEKSGESHGKIENDPLFGKIRENQAGFPLKLEKSGKSGKSGENRE